jgi:hypothetical protein
MRWRKEKSSSSAAMSYGCWKSQPAVDAIQEQIN